ncbi:MAG: PQQ-binding-like beta-propeller repeat protein [Ktedonobacteraceae bacterium]
MSQKPGRAAEGQETVAIIVAALNGNDGTKIWQTTLTTFPANSPSSGPNIELTVDGTLLYAVYSAQYMSQVVALDARTGDILWKHTEGMHPISQTIAANGLFYVKVKPSVRASIAQTPGEKVEDLDALSEKLHALEARSGKLLWSVSTTEYTLGQFAVNSKAVYLVQEKFVESDPRPRGTYNVAIIRALDATNGMDLWQKEIENTVGQMPLSYSGTVLQADDSAVYLLKFMNQLKTIFWGYSSVDIRTLVTLSAQDGSLLWSVNDPEPYRPDISSGASLTLCDHMLYVKGVYHMSMFNARDGKVLGSYQSSLYLWLFVSADHLYGRTPAGSLCCLKSGDGTKRWCANISPVIGTTDAENIYLIGHPNTAYQRARFYLRDAPFLFLVLVFFFMRREPRNAIYVLKQKNGRKVRRYLPGNPAQVRLYTMASGDI